MNTRIKIILGSKRALSTSIDNLFISRTIHAPKPFMHDCELCEAGGEEYCDSCRSTSVSRILEDSRKESA